MLGSVKMGIFSFVNRKVNEIKEAKKLSKELKLVKIQGEKEYSRKLAEIYSLKNTDEISTLHKIVENITYRRISKNLKWKNNLKHMLCLC